jgi:hypothetical protein
MYPPWFGSSRSNYVLVFNRATVLVFLSMTSCGLINYHRHRPEATESMIKSKSNGDEVSPCITPLWIGNKSDKYLPLQILLHNLFKHVWISLTSFIYEYIKLYENCVHCLPSNWIISFPDVCNYLTTWSKAWNYSPAQWVRIPLLVWIFVRVYSMFVLFCVCTQGTCGRLIPRPRSPTDWQDQGTEE